MNNKLKFFLNYLLIFFGVFILVQTFTNQREIETPLDQGDLAIEVVKNSYAVGRDVKVDLKLNDPTISVLSISPLHPCNPESELVVERFIGGAYEEVQASWNQTDCQDINIAPLELQNGKRERLSLLDMSYSYFSETGRYRISYIPTGESEPATFSPEFEIRKPSTITRLWRTLIYAPILNSLIGLLVLLPGSSLALSVIILTLIVRTILLIPSNKAIKAQRRLQEVQPKLEKIRKQYENDQARLAQETMAVWKEHKVSPFSSCLPLLIQFPILIALFYVIQGGLTPDKAGLIYDAFSEFSIGMMNSQFFMFDLLEQNIIVFPLVIGTLQFIQMQLMTRGRNKKKEESKDKAPQKAGDFSSEMQQANKMMTYIMPIMIAIFTAQLPAAVGLYWGVGTFYGIIQHLVVNKSGSSEKIDNQNEDGVTVKVIQKTHGKTN